METTGKMKDFYDIYYIATTFDFVGRKLREAIYETLTNRGRPYEKDSISDIYRLTKRKMNFSKAAIQPPIGVPSFLMYPNST